MFTFVIYWCFRSTISNRFCSETDSAQIRLQTISNDSAATYFVWVVFFFYITDTRSLSIPLRENTKKPDKGPH